MNTLIAIGHIIGCITVVLSISAVAALLTIRFQNKTADKAFYEVCLQAGIPIEKAEEPDNANHILKVQLDKFSPDYFQNRLSDFIGVLVTVLVITQTIVLLGVTGVVIWNTITDSLSNAKWIWTLLPLQLAFILLNLLIYVMTSLLTGRTPGQAKSVRSALLQYAQQNL